jgi:hypothetical protein
VIGHFATQLWLGPAMILAAGALLIVPSLARGKLRLQHQAAVQLASRPLVFWPVLAFIAAGRLALLWAACGARPLLG